MNRVNNEILRSAEIREYSTKSFPMDYLTAIKNREELVRHETQREIFLRNESIAKNIIDSLPPTAKFTLTQRSEEEPNGEISYQVIIKKKEDDKIFFGIENSKTIKSCNYLGFCLQSKLLIRDKDGNPTPNQELIEKLSQNTASMPQTRQNAA